MNYLEQIKESIEKYLQQTSQNVNEFLNQVSNNIVQTYELYKKKGEEDNSQEAQKLHQGLDEFYHNVENFLKEFDRGLTEFLIEAQKSSEYIFQQFQTFFSEKNIVEFQQKIQDFTKQLEKQTPQSLFNAIQQIFNKQTNLNEEEISIIFSESDRKEKSNKDAPK
jgi:hypothetical protein